MTRASAPPLLAAAFGAAFLVWSGGASAQRPCNPVIDGTYCAEQMPRGSLAPTRSPVQMRPIEDIGSAISAGSNDIGTFGGISFSRGTNCIGLLRRGTCNQ